jgi:hypothetical protein
MNGIPINEVPDDTSEEQRLLSTAISLFEEGDDVEAAILFGQVVSLAGELAEPARRYLKLIEERTERLFAAAEQLLNQNQIRKARRLFQIVSNIDSQQRAEAQTWLNLIDNRLSGPEERIPVLPAFSDASRGIRSSPRTLLKQTPHLDISPQPPLIPGSTIAVIVYADNQRPRDAEKTQDIILEISSDIKFITLEVHLLATSHFLINPGSTVKTLMIDTNGSRSTSAKFDVKVRSAEDLNRPEFRDQPSGFTALFFYRGRPCGSVSVIPEIIDPVELSYAGSPTSTGIR